MKKPSAKKLEDILCSSSPKDLLRFLKNIKDREVYEKEQLEKHFNKSSQALRRWIHDSDEIKRYVCYIKTSNHLKAIFVTPKYRKELISSGIAEERHNANA